MRKICIVTGSRAEYGHLYWLARDIAGDAGLTLQFLVTGMHLEPRFGLTYREIEADGFVIDEKVEMHQDDDTPLAVAQSMGEGVAGIARALDRLRPDILVILGDRFEMLAAAEAALVMGIPIAHLHGGELTTGAFDEAIRHSITKMAHLHFVASRDYARRVVQLGEDPARVHCAGAPGLEFRDPHMTQEALEKDLGFGLSEPLFLVTYHPETLTDADPGEAADTLTRALDDYPQARVIITGVNADPANRKLDAVFKAYAQAGSERVLAVSSLGRRRYTSALALASVVIGNSSSGLIEAPALGTPTINIGDRQRGRLSARSVIDCPAERGAIRDAIANALAPDFQKAAAEQSPPYGKGGGAAAIKEILATADLDGIIFKEFHDLAAAPT